MRRSVFNCCLTLVIILLPLTAHAELGKADIAVIEVTVDSDCYVVATVKNVGTTPLPVAASDMYYGTTIAFLKNGAQNSEYSFSTGLRQPGGTGTYNGGITSQVNGTAVIGAKFNPHGSYEDINPANNIMSKTVTCTPAPKPKPDLTITSLGFTADCRPIIRVANIGTAAVGDTDFETAYLQRKVDNLPSGQVWLKTIDRAGRLKSPQGSVEWIDGKDYTPKSTLQYAIANTVDANFNNNFATVTLPDRCKTPAPPRQIRPVAP
jgi:hypothetical protein